jgi:ATP-dependent helicase YprA (DUF1998 family)
MNSFFRSSKRLAHDIITVAPQVAGDDGRDLGIILYQEDSVYGLAPEGFSMLASVSGRSEGSEASHFFPSGQQTGGALHHL